MNRYSKDTPRAEFVRQRRSTTPRQKNASRSAHSSLVERLMPVKPAAQPRQRERAGGTGRQQYQFTYAGSRPRVHAPAIHLPVFNMRWVSAVMAAGLIFLAASIWNSKQFEIKSAEVTGNAHLSVEEIYMALDMDGEPIFTAVPAEMQTTLRNNLPQLQSCTVQVGFPDRISIEVSERIPVLDWFTFDSSGEVLGRKLVDINGVYFEPQEDTQGLIVVYATGEPPALVAPEEKTYDTPFVSPEMVQALVALVQYVPANTPVAYDPEYGIGWQDVRGWRVFFGHDLKDIEVKISTYQAIADALEREGIEPELISLAYLETPFIK